MPRQWQGEKCGAVLVLSPSSFIVICAVALIGSEAVVFAAAARSVAFVPRPLVRWRSLGGSDRVVVGAFDRRASARRRRAARATSLFGIEDSASFSMPPADGFYVRSAVFTDLRAVAEIFVDSFYAPDSLMKHYYRLLELDRIQNNFPYDANWHDYYVACSEEDGSVVAFVDVDARKLPKHWGASAPPRPYLSDLAVHSDWRRRGVATSLIVRCEDKAREMGYGELYLRVERDNDAALSMYGRMGYEVRDHPYFGVKDNTTLLRGELPECSRAEAVDADNKKEGQGEESTISYRV